MCDANAKPLHTRPTLSRRLHRLCFRDADQSLCARAWGLRDVSPFWARVVWLMDMFDPGHCERSHRFYHGGDGGRCGIEPNSG